MESIEEFFGILRTNTENNIIFIRQSSAIMIFTNKKTALIGGH